MKKPVTFSGARSKSPRRPSGGGNTRKLKVNKEINKRPIQKIGIDTPTSENDLVIESRNFPCFLAAKNPNVTPPITPSVNPKPNNSRVGGILLNRSLRTGNPEFQDVPQSPESSFFRYMTYCSKNGLVKPNSSLIRLIVAASACGPATKIAGFELPNRKIPKDRKDAPRINGAEKAKRLTNNMVNLFKKFISAFYY